ncbi:condensation domain-containing protein, partial [Rugosimonospora africana]|uniref:condensation domain-containing protein n=1 Tax=Rugosimonospora africana TaxID=556532 RepID=UPI0027E3FBD8
MAEADVVAAEERGRRFDLGRPPLLRLVLVRLAAQRFRLILTKHHIVLDGWSVPLLLGELFALYVNGGDSAGLPRVKPYREYLRWLAGQDRQAAKAVWQEALSGVEPTLIAGAVVGQSGVLPRRVPLTLSRELTAAVQRLARANELTVNTVVQGVWGLLLARLTGRQDVVFGAVVSGRSPEIAGVERMLGLFINTVPVRVRYTMRDTVRTILARVQREQLHLQPYHYLGLPEIQSTTATGNLFDTVTVFENYPV